MSALTPWFPAHVKPVRAGWYVREWGWDAPCDWFDGSNWFNGGYADDKSRTPSGMKLKWRGLAADPATGAAS